MGVGSVQGYGDATGSEMQALGMGWGAAGLILMCEARLVNETFETVVVHVVVPKLPR